jgi:hypothetical protein
MNLTKFIKGTTTIGEFENLPNRFIHVIYREYIRTMTNEDGVKNIVAEETVENLEETMGG